MRTCRGGNRDFDCGVCMYAYAASAAVILHSNIFFLCEGGESERGIEFYYIKRVFGRE